MRSNKSLAARGVGCLVVHGMRHRCLGAGEPPLDVPSAGVLSAPADVLSYGGWLFYPEITVYAVGTNNLFQTPTDPIAVGGVGYIPKLVRNGQMAFTQRRCTAISSSDFIRRKAI